MTTAQKEDKRADDDDDEPMANGAQMTRLRWLCEKACDESEKTRLRALEEIEKEKPAIGKHIVTLVVDSNLQNQQQALVAIATMGNQARDALPVLLRHLRKMRDSVNFDYGHEHWILLADISAVAKTAPDDREVIKELASLAALKKHNSTYINCAAIESLGEIASHHPKVRDAILPHLVKCLDGQWTRIPAMQAIAKFGPDGREAAPAIKKYRFDPDANTREAATAALDRVDK
jgi:hypothetical protein